MSVINSLYDEPLYEKTDKVTSELHAK